MTRKRLTKEQQQDITRQMLEESRTLTEQGVSLREVKQRVAELRNDLVKAAREGVALMMVARRAGTEGVQRIETARGIQYELRNDAGETLRLSSQEAYGMLEALYQRRDTLYQDVHSVLSSE